MQQPPGCGGNASPIVQHAAIAFGLAATAASSQVIARTRHSAAGSASPFAAAAFPSAFADLDVVRGIASVESTKPS